jgi:serine protease Do
VTLKGKSLYTDEPVIAACRERSPAAAAGLRPGDRITAVDGREIRRAADFRSELGRRYAGDTLRMTVLRSGRPVECSVRLVDKLTPVEQDAAQDAQKPPAGEPTP